MAKYRLADDVMIGDIPCVEVGQGPSMLAFSKGEFTEVPDDREDVASLVARGTLTADPPSRTDASADKPAKGAKPKGDDG